MEHFKKYIIAYLIIFIVIIWALIMGRPFKISRDELEVGVQNDLLAGTTNTNIDKSIKITDSSVNNSILNTGSITVSDLSIPFINKIKVNKESQLVGEKYHT